MTRKSQKNKELSSQELDFLRAALEPSVEVDLSLQRSRAVAHLRSERVVSTVERNRASFFSLKTLAAAASLVFVFGAVMIVTQFSSVGITPQVTSIEGVTGSGNDPAVPNGIKLVSYPTNEGTVLEWSGIGEDKVRILKSKGKKDFSGALVSEVEGSTWVDSNGSGAGCVYYRIERLQAKKDSVI